MKKNFAPWRHRLHEIIFEADTKLGKLFDVTLLILIIISIVLVMLQSVADINQIYGSWFEIAEWIITVYFTIEYILRLSCVYRPSKYAFSFFGIIDLLSILPSYLELIFGMTSYFAAVRAMRLIRVFRIFKLAKFLDESNSLMAALRASQAKITVFLTFILMMVVVIGSVMYFVEGGQDSGFTSIPRSIYWAIVTLTTVGYGDIAPTTSVGQLLAAIVMIMGYGVLAVPTGIVSAELVNTDSNSNHTPSTQVCKECLSEGHDADALFCKYCGENL
ncbi:ion transporter [Aureispira anguillae]|uniref:Ion transporter n=1 Tax=Aureispira anguillae TaxID=2864201 RepID=A0A916DVG1_9BACT|nr:ion transporter [Aureispira anguillae]BDS13525.1 ion transporter [Aureispira anguillae]